MSGALTLLREDGRLVAPSDRSTALALDALGCSVLVLGGARSGKSAFGERLIEDAGGGIYLATAEARDDEMAARIAAHKARRGDAWQTIEEPIRVPDALDRLSDDGTDRPVLLDCITLWLSNIMEQKADIAAETERLLAALAAAPFPTVSIANEVGGGIVPDNALARAFRDQAGLVNQRLAAAADAVILVTAGLPQRLK